MRSFFSIVEWSCRVLFHRRLISVLFVTDKSPDYPSQLFGVWKGKSIRDHDEYSTRRVVLAAWDWMEANGEFAPMGM